MTTAAGWTSSPERSSERQAPGSAGGLSIRALFDDRRRDGRHRAGRIDLMYRADVSFDREDLEALAGRREIRIETKSRPDGPVHSAIIWVVVDGEDVFIRSWLGARARWYREATANPAVTVVAGDRRLHAVAEQATDPDSVRRCSNGFLTKYRRSKSAQSMVAEDILDTTLRLEPS
jgi:hypothetical protein